MESFLEKSAQTVEAHSLPFRVIFEEHLRRNRVELLAQAKLIFRWESPEEALRDEIVKQENAYRDLAAANLSIGEGRCPLSSLDELTAKCEVHDDRLKRLLHAMNASALCLSGGGIRSASFSLGVLEGLSLFSGSQKRANGLMHNLDYLSTVSGGGYIGSWFISWVQQRRVAKDILPPAKALIQCIADNREKISTSNLKALQCSAKNLVSAARAIQQQARAIWPPYESFEDLIECINRQATALEEEADRLARKTVTNARSLDEDKKEAESCWRLAEETLSAAISPFSTKAYSDGCMEAISAQAYSEVVAAMAGNQSVTSGDAEPRPVRHLRSYTSYLAPSMGFSLDTFTLAAIVLRNLLVNWVMVIPVLLTLISLAQITGFGTAHLQAQSSKWWPSIVVWNLSGGQLVLGGIVAFLFIVAALAAGFSLPSHHEKLNHSVRRWSVAVFVVMVVLASWLLTVSQSTISEFSPFNPSLWLKAVICMVDFGVLAVSIWLAYKERIGQINLGRSRGRVGAGVMNVIATLSISLLTGWLLQLDRLYVYPILLSGGSSPFLQQLASDSRLFIVFALPITLTILMATTSLFCALLGIFEMEQDREWWVRCGGAFLIFNLVWILAHGIAFYGEDGWKTVVAGVSGLGLGLLGSLLGSSGATSAGPRPVKAAQLTSVGGFFEKHHMVLPSIGGLSLCLIALGIAAAEESIRKAMVNSRGELASAVELFVISLIFSVLINFAININLFSLYGMYRMRLMRAFLGASNVFRRPDPFTNFDPKDTPYETDLPACHGVPLHVINTTLNLTGTKNTAWRQRRAESFTFSPIECGGWRVGYVKTECYGGTRGVTLATAMSISGAAFNPNMGYQSSPILSLLMTFFNLRLGCWLPNPKRPKPKMGLGSQNEVFFRKSGPTCALQPLIAEALGNTDDTYRWIELTDGGHFENLGLYEMVMRRCKNIIVVDAGADPLCQFEDLGNAIRKIRIDLGIPIVFSPPDIRMREGMKANNSYCAVARIQYHCVDEVWPGKSPDDLNGWLVYIKAGLTGEEPADILQYAKTHSTFPHETTGDQFFSESQFESYRHLGSHIIRCIVDAAPCPQPRMEEMRTFSTFVKAAQNYWNSKGPM